MSDDYPSIGSVIEGKYRVERILGQGAMGVVLAATHLELDQRVAIKVLQSSQTERDDGARRFLREARACVKIQSEHVVRVLDVGRLRVGSPYIVMEYLEGRDLAGVLVQRGPLPVLVAVDYILQACDGVAAAHAQGIVHRDLKPSNLFLTSLPDGGEIVKVIDFGISKARLEPDSRDVVRTQGMLGSPIYMSPEQMTASQEIDTRCDIWAFGVILYELLTGRPPFSADNIPQVCALVLHGTAAAARLVRPDVPLMLEEIIHRCLQKDPGRRFAHVGELATYLADFASPSLARLAARASRVPLAGQPGQPG
jgi:serine/threonine-protein kinase